MKGILTIAALLLIPVWAWAEVATVGDIVHGVTADKRRHALGAAIKITYAIRNQGKEPVTYRFSSGKLFDVWITRGDTEVYRHSDGRVYTQAITSITLGPNEVRRFEVTWDQRDRAGKPIGPGAYTAYARLTPSKNPPDPVKVGLRIGGGAAVVPVKSIREAITNASALKGKTIYLTANYRGFRPNPDDANTKTGPPVSRSDWAICDSTGCMYVHGSAPLSACDLGTPVNVTGRLQKTSEGQVYLVLVSVRKAGKP